MQRIAAPLALALALSTTAHAAAPQATTPTTTPATAAAVGAAPAKGDKVLHDQTLQVAMNGAIVGTIKSKDTETPTGFRLERESDLHLMRGDTVNDIKSSSLSLLAKDFSPQMFRYVRQGQGPDFILEGRIVGGELVLTTIQGGTRNETRTKAPPNVTFATALELATRRDLRDGMKVTRDVVLEEMGAIVKMDAQVQKKASGFLVTTKVEGLVTSEEVDAKGNTILARTPAVGVIAWPVGATPPKEVGKGDVDLLARSTWPAPLLKAPTRVRYRVRTPDAATFVIPEDARQKIIGRDKGFIDVEVVAGLSSTGALSAAERERLTRSTPYETKDDPRIVQAAQTATAGAKTTREKVSKLVAFVDKHVQNKTLDRGYAPALATLESRTGDCTEHSVLLSALLRAIGIPTRLVDGVIIDGHRAGYHEWVEAQIDDEGFVAADPTFGAFPAGPERLKLAQGSTAPDEQLQLSLAASRLLRPGVVIEVLEATPPALK